jgi:hypothetical protein
VEQVPYKTIEPPFTLNFKEMSKLELRDYYRWFLGIIANRLAELAGAVRGTPGFESWAADFTPSSLDALGNWFATEVETRPRTLEEMEELAAKSAFPMSSRVLTNRTISLAVDIGMYLSQVLLRNNSSLKWDQLFRGKTYIDYGQPVLIGFIDKVPRNPVRVITTLAYGLIDKAKPENGLRVIYDRWSRCFVFDESR